VIGRTPQWPVRRHRARGPGGFLALAAGAVAALAVLWSVADPVVSWLPGTGGTRSGGAVWVDGYEVASASAARVPDDVPPTRLRIPAIGVDAALESLHLDAAGALQAPRVYDRPGWYADGTKPGTVGPAVIAGHVDSTRGAAVFFRLHELTAGDRVEVSRGGQWIAFRVVATSRYAKSRFPTAQVYGPTPDPQLRLITCGGAFDQARRSYLDNVVVFAVLA
jgi:LPXTG-site transpeptidase (sortase) family protein